MKIRFFPVVLLSIFLIAGETKASSDIRSQKENVCYCEKAFRTFQQTRMGENGGTLFRSG